jgi:hypothetical protein
MANGQASQLYGISSTGTGNNFNRPGGQNVGNFLGDRPSSRVLAAPGGYSTMSLGHHEGPTTPVPPHLQTSIPLAEPAPAPVPVPAASAPTPKAKNSKFLQSMTAKISGHAPPHAPPAQVPFGTPVEVTPATPAEPAAVQEMPTAQSPAKQARPSVLD